MTAIAHRIDNKHIFDKEYPDFHKDNESNGHFGRILSQEVEPVPVSKYFFSGKNIDHLIMLCCRITSETIYQKNGISVKFDQRYQSKTELVNVMKDAYLEQCSNPLDQFSADADVSKKSVREEVAKLNRIVLNVVSNAMYENYLNYRYYKNDIVKGPQYGDHPVCFDKAKNDNRELSSIFFG